MNEFKSNTGTVNLIVTKNSNGCLQISIKNKYFESFQIYYFKIISIIIFIFGLLSLLQVKYSYVSCVILVLILIVYVLKLLLLINSGKSC